MRLGKSLAALAVSVLLAGCGGREQQGQLEARPRSTAKLSIVQPSSGDQVVGPQVVVRLDLQGGRIVPQASKNLTPDTGHIHLIVDGKLVSQTYGLEQTVTVEPGRHVLQAEYVAADHSPFNPRVLTSITFTST